MTYACVKVTVFGPEACCESSIQSALLVDLRSPSNTLSQAFLKIALQLSLSSILKLQTRPRPRPRPRSGCLHPRLLSRSLPSLPLATLLDAPPARSLLPPKPRSRVPATPPTTRTFRQAYALPSVRGYKVSRPSTPLGGATGANSSPSTLTTNDSPSFQRLRPAKRRRTGSNARGTGKVEGESGGGNPLAYEPGTSGSTSGS